MYQHAKDGILQYIQQNRDSLDKLPSEQEFANRMGISRNTVREAIRILEREGVLYSRHGVGTFLVKTGQKLVTSIGVLESATKIIEAHGFKAGTVNVQAQLRPVGRRVGECLNAADDTPVLYIERVRSADGKPVVYVEDYILGDDSLLQRYRKEQPESLLAFLEGATGSSIGHVICGIKAVISGERIAKQLQLASPSALLLLEQTHYSVKGQPIFYSDSYFLSDQFQFNIIRQRI